MSSTNCFTCREKSSSHRQINSLRSNPFSRVGTSPSSCVFNFIEEKSRPPKKERKKKSCFVSSLMWFVFFFIFFSFFWLLLIWWIVDDVLYFQFVPPSLHGLDDFVLATQVHRFPFGIIFLLSGQAGSKLGSRHVQIQTGIGSGRYRCHRERTGRRSWCYRWSRRPWWRWLARGTNPEWIEEDFPQRRST